MSGHNPYGGTQQDLIDAYPLAKERFDLLTRLVNAFNAIDQCWTLGRADEIEAALQAAASHVGIAAPAKPATAQQEQDVRDGYVYMGDVVGPLLTEELDWYYSLRAVAPVDAGTKLYARRNNVAAPAPAASGLAEELEKAKGLMVVTKHGPGFEKDGYLLEDADVAAIIAALRSQPAGGGEGPKFPSVADTEAEIERLENRIYELRMYLGPPVYWLIEHKHYEPRRYRTLGKPGPYTWETDPLGAQKYASKADADLTVAMMDEPCEAFEHMDCDGPDLRADGERQA